MRIAGISLRSRPGHRLVGTLIAAATACGLVAACSTGGSSAGGDQKTVVFLGFGSEYQSAMEKVTALFKQQTGISVQYNPGVGSALLAKVQASKSNPTADAMWATPLTYVQGASQGLFAKLEPTIVSNLDKIDSGDREPGDLGVVMGNLEMGLMYNADEFKANNIPTPTSWADLWNPALKGHVAINSMDGAFAQIDFPEIAKIFGGSIDNMEPLWPKLKALKPSLAGIANDPASMNTLFQKKQAWLTDFSNARVYALAAQSGLPIEFVAPKEGAVAFPQPVAVVKNAPHEKAAQQFVNFLLTPEAQKIFATELFLRPVISGVDLPADIAAKVGYGASASGDSLVEPETTKIAANLQSWSKSFNDAVG